VRPTPFLAIGILLAATNVAAQAPPIFEFSFSNPGARSLGLGGAFAGLADDATAAFANPAGLVQLSRPEVSVEGRLWSYSTPFTLGGRLDGRPTGIGLDDAAGLRVGESSQDLVGLSFLSFVYPRSDWSIAVYRHQSANFEFRSESQGFFGDALPPFRFRREDDIRISLDFEVVSYGVSAAYRVKDELSLGIGFSYVDGKLTSQNDQFALTEENLPEGFFGPNSYNSDARWVSTVILVDDSAWTFNLGLLWHISRQWSLGGFFRQGPGFRLEGESLSGPFLRNLGLPEGTVLESAESPIKFPNVFGAGVAFKTKNEALTVVAEWDRVQYTTIVESVDPLAFETDDSAVNDANELRAGFEYVFLNWTPTLALRAGTWFDPDHRIVDVSGDPFADALSQPGDDQWHFTAGVGIVIRGFQMDAGFDLADAVKTASLSAVFSF
jgi:long-subunit fatty acid transport protein